MMGWQLPPLNWQPFLLMKKQSIPFFTVVQTMAITSFLKELLNSKVYPRGKTKSNKYCSHLGVRLITGKSPCSAFPHPPDLGKRRGSILGGGEASGGKEDRSHPSRSASRFQNQGNRDVFVRIKPKFYALGKLAYLLFQASPLLCIDTEYCVNFHSILCASHAIRAMPGTS